MHDIVEAVEKIKMFTESLEQLNKTTNELKAELKVLKKQLKESFDLDSVEEAEQVAEQMKSALVTLEQEIIKEVEEIENEYFEE